MNEMKFLTPNSSQINVYKKWALSITFNHYGWMFENKKTKQNAFQNLQQFFGA